ncbi:hypothetical protein [Peribacillus kribbensis]|uniref:hypothetical protein n=1 Tax=Peribacillus kribbensis TaxID=356658 RepID=UPI000412E0B3|nr:hypothetical protein [Peribacillus kribbensis]
MKTYTKNTLAFKSKLSTIEQNSVTDFINKWAGSPASEIEGTFLLTYVEDETARLETAEGAFHLPGGEELKYITLTEENQIVIGVLNSDRELVHRILYLDERLYQ